MARRACQDRLEAVSGLYGEWRIFTENGIKITILLGRDGQQSGLVDVNIPFDNDGIKAVSVSTTDFLYVSGAGQIFTVVGPGCASRLFGKIKRDRPDHRRRQLKQIPVAFSGFKRSGIRG